MRTRTLLSSLLTVIACAAPGVAGAEAAMPWDRPFSADTAALARAAAQHAAPPDSEAQVLFEEGRYQFDEQGRVTYTYRQVARLLRASAIDSWDSWSVGWVPWYQERPTMRARVIARDGRVRELDPATIEERSSGGDAPDIYSDEKELRAPLPGVAEGALIEVEIVARDKAPFFDAGGVHRFYFGKDVPVERTRLVIDAPKRLPIAVKAVALPHVATSRSESQGRVVRTFEAAKMAALPAPETNAPPGLPKIVFATGASWAAIAQRYARIVDEAIATGDVAQLAADARRGASGREAIAERLLARLHQEVRYAGIEFGAASIVPTAPARTLARQLGDCKDQATLLVALLRASGVPAHVALLRTGPGTDADAALPGLDFDHAIVYVPGSPALWIDPTDRFARVGELPLVDQGRHALVAAASTSALTDTPAPRAAQNTIIEERTYELPEEGKARIVEVTRPSGEVERQYRNYRSDVDARKDREQLEGYVKDVYLAAKLDKMEVTDANDLGRRYELRLESSDSGRGQTFADHAEVGIFPQAVLGELPEELRDKHKPTQPRRSEYLLFRPVHVEHRYHIVPPPGYAASTLPAPERIAVGPWHIDVRFDKAADGRIDGLVSFETDRTRLTAQEFDAVRSRFAELDEQDGKLVVMENVAEAHLTAGRVQEGMAELRRLAALHPKEARHAIDLSRALLRFGLGAAARDKARQAVTLEPKNAAAWAALAAALRCDLVGRSDERGWDYAGAEAALRRAKALDPNNAETRVNLAILLEYDADATRYAPHARLSEAAAEYRAVHKELGRKDFDQNLLILLMRMGRTDEVKALAHEMPQSTTRDTVVVSAVAMHDGVEAAWKETLARGKDSAARNQVLSSAVATLLELREYAASAGLAQHFGEVGGNEVQRAQAQRLAQVRRRETVTLAADDPAAFVRRLFVAAAAGHDPSAVQPLLFTESLPMETAAEETWVATQKMLGSMGMSRDVFADVVSTLSNLPLTVEGDARWGWRVHIVGQLGTLTEFYVVRTAQGLRLLSDGTATRLAERMLAALEHGDVEAARHWLVWLKQTLPAGVPIADPLVDVRADEPKASREAMETAAALVLAWSPAGARAVAPLDRCLLRESPGPRRASCARARAAALASAKRNGEALTAVDTQLGAHPDDALAAAMRMVLLDELGQPVEADRAAAELQRRWPNDTQAAWAVASLALGRGRCADARRAIRAMIDAKSVDAHARNEYAWCALAAGPVSDDDVAQARLAADETGRARTAVLNTLAMLLAERGQLDAARDTLREALPAGWPMRDGDWLVVGRIAEAAGLIDDARRAYAHIPAPAGQHEQDVRMVAQRRRAGLGSASAATTPGR